MRRIRWPRVFALIVVAGGITFAVLQVRAHNKQTMWDMWADMHNLATAQTAYSMDHASYAMDLIGHYAPTHGAIVRVTAASDTSWSAYATHPRTSKVCSMTHSEPRNATMNQVIAARSAAMTAYACK